MLENIVRLQIIDTEPDVPLFIGASQIILLMPIFRWDGTHYIDATGDYDLCMSHDGLTYEFINRRSTAERYAYRFISPFWFVNRAGKQGR